MMKIDWNSVKKQTLWSFEDLISKLQAALAYGFVHKHYDHTMKQAQQYAKKIHRGYLQNQNDKLAYINSIVTNFKMLDQLRIEDYSMLIRQIETQADCMDFLRRTDFEFEPLIQTLNYLLRWVLPFPASLRGFINVDQAVEIGYLSMLKKQKIRSNLDLLEVGQSPTARVRLARATGIPEDFVTTLVHRADISRLAYVRGKTVLHLCGGGYDTLAKIAAADLTEMERMMDAYYRTLGKCLADFKLVIPLPWMIGGAAILPRVVKM